MRSRCFWRAVPGRAPACVRWECVLCVACCGGGIFLLRAALDHPIGAKAETLSGKERNEPANARIALSEIAKLKGICVQEAEEPGACDPEDPTRCRACVWGRKFDRCRSAGMCQTERPDWACRGGIAFLRPDDARGDQPDGH